MTVRNLSTHLGGQLPATDDMLHWLGLQQRRNAADVTLGLLGSFALGTLVGSALALLFAPKAGDELRRDLGDRIGQATQRVAEQLKTTESTDAVAAS